MTVRILRGHVLDRLGELPDESVHCCVTSPPYWGLRDYGTAQWSGGDEACDHLGRSQTSDSSTLGEWKSGGGQEYKEQAGGMPFRDVCGKCGAVRIDRQLGLEKTPEEYVANMVAVFREVRRVLRDDGTLWLNLGDSYYAGGWECRRVNAVGNGSMPPEQRKSGMAGKIDGLKVKDLVGIPWRVAFALQADGWYLRQDIIWHKPNPMPESVTDRCTKAHEYIFLLSKSERYYYDQEAIFEEFADERMGASGTLSLRYSEESGRNGDSGLGRIPRRSGNKARKDATERGCPESGADGSVPWEGFGRNKRSVWTVTTQPFKEAHFATFPPALIEPCILAGCPVGGTVLDPFGGAGTTGLVADRLQRDAILIELNPEYADMAERRIKGDSPLFAEVE